MTTNINNKHPEHTSLNKYNETKYESLSSITITSMTELSLHLPILLILGPLASATESHDYLSKGLIFHKETKILRAEKFVNVEFLIPFPTYNRTTLNSTEKLLKKLASMWTLPSAFCPMDFSTNCNFSDSAFNMNWMVKKIKEESKGADAEVEQLQKTTAELLSPHEENRARRSSGSSIGTASLLAGVGLFGPGVILQAFGGDCGITGSFGGCQQ